MRTFTTSLSLLAAGGRVSGGSSWSRRPSVRFPANRGHAARVPSIRPASQHDFSGALPAQWLADIEGRCAMQVSSPWCSGVAPISGKGRPCLISPIIERVEDDMPNLLLLTAWTVALLSVLAMLTPRAVQPCRWRAGKHRDRHRQDESCRASSHGLHTPPRLPPGRCLRVEESLQTLVARRTGMAWLDIPWPEPCGRLTAFRLEWLALADGVAASALPHSAAAQRPLW